MNQGRNETEKLVVRISNVLMEGGLFREEEAVIYFSGDEGDISKANVPFKQLAFVY